MSDELTDLIQGFVEESQESFESIESDLLAIEDNPNDLNIVNGIFRVLHTIKGTAGFMGLDDINRLSHKLETIFDMIRKEELGITPELLDQLLPAIDLLKLMVFELLEEQKSDYRLQATMALLESINTDGAAPRVELGNSPIAVSEPELVLEEVIEPAEEEAPEDVIPVSEALLQDFVVEAEEHLEHIEEALLKLEKNPKDEESIHEVFRGTHSIKGIAGYVNLTKITRLSHRLETIFDGLRKGSSQYTNEMADVVLKGLDLLRTLIFMIKMAEDVSLIQVDDVIEQLGQFVEVKKNAASQAPAAAKKTAKPDAGKYTAFQNLCNQQVITLQAVGADVIAERADEDDLMLFERGLNTLQKAAMKLQLAPVTDQTEKLLGFVGQLIKGTLKVGDIAADVQDSLGTLIHIIEIIQSASAKEIDQLAVQAMANAQQSPAKKEAPKTEQAPAAKAETAVKAHDTDIKTMRVDAARLDIFMNLIGELIIARNSLNHALGEMPTNVVPTEVMNSLKFVEGAFNRISEDLQMTLMDLRLIPVKTVFQKIPRIVRDISRKTGKQIQLQMVGENTQIDKSIIEVIGDPLIHIIRNSCDHGVETMAERAKVGKPEQGNIILKASNQGGAIAIDIIDDGAGINTAKVLEKAIEKGLVRPDQAKLLDDKAINQFIFHPGFSTADQVTDISGRGVGMDVVITNIAKVNGSVDVESEQGHGTQIRLLLPLTLAVIDALLIVENGQKYAIPLEAVKESIEVKRSELQLLKQKEAINLRGDIIGIAHLHILLDLTKEEDKDPDKVVSVVFIHVGPRVLGIVVDDLSNQQEIVVKPLESYLTQIPGISGSTILGSGEIILILEPTELVDLAAQ